MVCSTHAEPFQAEAPTAPPDDAPGKKGCRKRLEQAIEQLDDLQRRLYATDYHSVLLVFQAMDAAGKDSTIRAVMRGIDELTVNLSGSGSSAFVDSIGGLSTDASQGWTFKVDGEFANQGIGLTVLHPPTTVVWTYGSFEM